MSREPEGTDPEDLSARSRRGELSRAEQRELSRALAVNPTLAVAHAVGSDLDRSTAVRAGDEELVRRAADAALARIERASLSPVRVAPARNVKPRARLAALLAAVAMILASGVAFAVWKGLVPTLLRKAAAPVAPPASTAPKTAPAPQVEPRAASTALDEVAPVELVAPDVLAPAPPVELAPSAPAHAARVVPGATAAELFRAANTSRRSGDLGRARKLYSELIAKHPSSDEASLARVSLGKLLLSSGDATEAEREFDRYLSDRKGPLAEEALVSRAESLEKLGRKDEERSTLEKLLREHPNTVYAARAKARLYVLTHAGDSPKN